MIDDEGWNVILNLLRMVSFMTLWHFTEPYVAYAFALFSICKAIDDVRLS